MSAPRGEKANFICSERLNRCVFLALLALIFALMLAMNVHTPLMMDDYDYSFSWSTGDRLSGLADIVRSQQAHYMIWGGRSVTHFFAQLFLYLGKPLFNAANALMYVLLLLQIYALAKKPQTRWDWRLVLAAHILLFFAVEFFGVVFLWLDGACNYLWGTVIALLPLLIARSERENGWFSKGAVRGWAALPVCFLAGWTNENTACAVLAVCGLLLAWDFITGRKICLWRFAAVLAQAAGVALLLLAPGNYARAAEETSRGFVMEMVYRIAVVGYCTVRYAGIPALLGLAALFVSVKRRKPVRIQWLCVLLGGAVLGAGALIGSPQISDRTFTGVIALLIAALLLVISDIKQNADRHSLCIGAAALLLCAVGGSYALGSVRAHEQAWLDRLAQIEQAAQAGETAVSVSSVPSSSRYTMAISLAPQAQAWPNSTMSKYFGIRIEGE